MDKLKKLQKKLCDFRDQRDWKQFHNPKDLAIALNIESSELLELFLWKKDFEYKEIDISDELADVLIYSLLLAESCNLDIYEISMKKIEKNESRYPVSKSKGNAKKHSELK